MSDRKVTIDDKLDYIETEIEDIGVVTNTHRREFKKEISSLQLSIDSIHDQLLAIARTLEDIKNGR